jgi:DNA-directed RNA polymerase sigma subunit (sigma70/sigma32)
MPRIEEKNKRNYEIYRRVKLSKNNSISKIADEYGITRQRVFQIYENVKNKIKKNPQSYMRICKNNGEGSTIITP